MNKMANFSFLTNAHTQVLGVCSIRIFAKNMGDPYYEPTIVVHDNNTVLTALLE